MTISFQGEKVFLKGKPLKVGENAPEITLVGKDFSEIKVGSKQDKNKLLALSQVLMDRFVLYKQKDSIKKLQNLKIA
ncbi:hypothetical protein [Helicobacter apodemus]|uniref:hypothetical protein n=1 Tax=Helicobacter apodemus TaxID=135569 RepID=UPI001EF230E0|nr:hypothetical protein [Helicobacter apodemus]